MENTIEGGVVCFAELCEYTGKNEILERDSSRKWRIPLKLLKIIMLLEETENLNADSRFAINVNLSEIEELLLKNNVVFCDSEKEYVVIENYFMDEPEEREYLHIKRIFVYLYMLERWQRRTEFLWVCILMPYAYRMQTNGINGELLLKQIDEDYQLAEIRDWVEANGDKSDREIRLLFDNLLEESEQYIKEELGVYDTFILYKYREKNANIRLRNDFMDGFRMLKRYIKKNEKQIQ